MRAFKKVALFLGLYLVLMMSCAAEPVPFRGVVEGYYGRPWGTEGRIALLNFMGKVKMNTFIYGPKDDPYHHGRWRELYPEDQIEDFKKVLEVAKKNRVVFIGRFIWVELFAAEMRANTRRCIASSTSSIKRA